MTLKPKEDIKFPNQKPCTLPLCHHTWLRKELTDIEKDGIVLPCNLVSPALSSLSLKEGPPPIIYLTEWFGF